MVNKVFLIGNLGKDPELRNTQGGTAVAKFSLATSERVKDGDGWKDHTEWHNVVVFGRTAENVGKYCRKGKPLFIEGKIRTRKWQDKSGQDRWSTEVIADEVRFLGGKDDDGRGESRRELDNYRTGRSGGGGNDNPPPSDDDIPF